MLSYTTFESGVIVDDAIDALSDGCIVTIPVSIAPKSESVVDTVIEAIVSTDTGFLTPFMSIVNTVEDDMPELPTIPERVKVYEDDVNEQAV